LKARILLQIGDWNKRGKSETKHIDLGDITIDDFISIYNELKAGYRK